MKPLWPRANCHSAQTSFPCACNQSQSLKKVSGFNVESHITKKQQLLHNNKSVWIDQSWQAKSSTTCKTQNEGKSWSQSQMLIKDHTDWSSLASNPAIPGLLVIDPGTAQIPGSQIHPQGLIDPSSQTENMINSVGLDLSHCDHLLKFCCVKNH